MPEAPTDDNLFDYLGEDAMTALVHHFYTRVRKDDIVGPLYPPDDWDNAERRLRLFLMQRFGGPTTYSDQRGHPRLRMRHMPFRITPAAAERWLELMRDSMQQCADDGLLDQTAADILWPYFVNTARFMINAEQ